MPTLKESKRNEQDLFRAAAQKASDRTDPALASPVEREKLAPHFLAEVPQQSQAPAEALARLFEHYAEKGAQDEATAGGAAVAPDALREKAREIAVADALASGLIRDGMEGDFIKDSAIVAADLDTHTSPDADWDGFAERRRRAESTQRSATRPRGGGRAKKEKT